MKRTIKSVLLIWIVAGLCGCFQKDGRKDLKAAQQLADELKFNEAMVIYNRVVKRFRGQDSSLIAARKASYISVHSLKDYKQALRYYKFLVLHSPDEHERFEAQKQVARIYFEHVGNYEQSIVEYSRLLESAETEREKIDFRKFIARGYFFLKNFFQAEVELRYLSDKTLTKDDLYDVLFLRGNIKMVTKEVDQAIEIFTKLIDDFPKRAKLDNVAIHLAICHEEKENFAKAIETLDEMRPVYTESEFIDDKIDRLKLRQKFLPGAKGLRK